jgi:hypothetical protein
MTIEQVIETFTTRLAAVLEAQALEQARASVLGAFGFSQRRGPGRPPKALQAPRAPAKTTRPKVAPTKKRKRAPLQLCPVPGCKNPAAPIFGMVCAKHKDVPKTKIKKFREARRAKKLGLKPTNRARRVQTKNSKPAGKTVRRKLSKPRAKVSARRPTPTKVRPPAKTNAPLPVAAPIPSAPAPAPAGA